MLNILSKNLTDFPTQLYCHVEVLYKFFEIVSKIYCLIMYNLFQVLIFRFFINLYFFFFFDQNYFHNKNFLILLPNLQKVVKLSYSTKSTTLPSFTRSIFSLFYGLKKCMRETRSNIFSARSGGTILTLAVTSYKIQEILLKTNKKRISIKILHNTEAP